MRTVTAAAEKAFMAAHRSQNGNCGKLSDDAEYRKEYRITSILLTVGQYGATSLHRRRVHWRAESISKIMALNVDKMC